MLARLFSRERSFGGDTHDQLLDLLSATITQGTGRGAALAIKAYGKTGTSQDSRDALFIGFAGDLVVGVWVGNDDNTPLKGINGGGLPARIWRDFMGSAVKGARPAPRPKAAAPADTPDDTLDIPDLPININNTDITLGNDSSVTLNTDIGGVKLDVTLGKDGFDINASPPPKRRE
jgi:penicillin-binding protein 1A